VRDIRKRDLLFTPRRGESDCRFIQIMRLLHFPRNRVPNYGENTRKARLDRTLSRSLKAIVTVSSILECSYRVREGLGDGGLVRLVRIGPGGELSGDWA
jgi:hypothetical protein